MVSFTLLCTGCSPVASLNQIELERINTNNDLIFNDSDYPVIIKNMDSYGKDEVSIYQKPPKRVIAIWQNSIETLLALGVGNQIVGAIGLPDGKYLKPEYQEQYNRIPYKSFDNPELETAMMLEPDMIVGWYSSFSNKTLRSTKFWKERGVHTYIAPDSSNKYSYRTVEHEYQDILNLGKFLIEKRKQMKLLQK